MLISARQIDSISLNLVIQQATSGAAFSGNLLAYVNGGGWLGNGVVYVTGAQDITGVKRFLDSPRVPYSGTSGSAPSAKWVNDQIGAYSGWATNTYILSQALTATGAALYTLIVNMSGALTGQGGGGGGSTNVGDWNSVYTTGTQTVGGVKTFSSSPIVPATLGGAATSATNLNDLIALSGVITGYLTGAGGASSVKITGSSSISIPNFTGLGSVVVSYDGTYVNVSGSSVGGGVTNNYFITGTGTINNTYNTSGNISNTFTDYTTQQNNYTITGNFNIASFFIDPIITGLNIVESFVGGMGYYFTGAAFSCRTSGFGPVNGGILSGKLYQVDFNNTEQTLYTFTFTSGIVYSGSPGFNIYVTGRNRVGLSITNSLSGIQKMCVGVFGGTYV